MLSVNAGAIAVKQQHQHNLSVGQPATVTVNSQQQPNDSERTKKSSFSSFGLHSPDNLPVTSKSRENDIKTIIKHLENNSGLSYPFAEGSLYLDPDIIDLTMIPPPITPDDVSSYIHKMGFLSRCFFFFN